MKDIKIAIRVCKYELEETNIPYGNILNVIIDYNSKSRYGRCIRKESLNGFEIEISSKLLEDYVPFRSLKTVLLHEFLHTCPGCLNHGNKWKYYVGILNSKYGYNISRLSSDEELGIISEKKEEDVFVKHEVVCTCCGKTYRRQRDCKLTKHPELYRCGECRGELELLY